MLIVCKKDRSCRGAKRPPQYGFIAGSDGKDKVVAVDARQGCRDCAKGGFSHGAKKWHKFTVGGKPICDDCKRVGHIAKSCWRKKQSSEYGRIGRGEEKGSKKKIVHSVVKCDGKSPTSGRYIPVSVLGQSLEAQLDCNALENAVDKKTLSILMLISQVGSGLKVYPSKSKKVGAIGMVWLPVVIGSRSEKLRCEVVENLKEKLVIGLPGLSFLGVKIDFATGDVRIGHRRKKKVDKDKTTVKKDEELLKRDSKLMRETSKGAETDKGIASKQYPETTERKEEDRNPSQKAKQAKKLVAKVSRDERSEVPNHVASQVSGGGRKEEMIKSRPVVKEKTVKDEEESDGECDSSSEEDNDKDTTEQVESKKNKQKHKSKKKKRKGKKGKKRK